MKHFLRVFLFLVSMTLVSLNMGVQTAGAQSAGTACHGAITLNEGQTIWKLGTSKWKTRTSEKVYCSARCAAGSKFMFKGGDEWFCKAEQVCTGAGQLKPGEETWKKAANMWKSLDGSKVYCSVSCTQNSTLTFVIGDTYYCKPYHPKYTCEQISNLFGTFTGHWGKADAQARKDWAHLNCDIKMPSCQTISNSYQVSYGMRAGKKLATFPAIQKAWSTQKCRTCQPGAIKDSEGICFLPESCQALSQKYGYSYSNGAVKQSDRRTIAWQVQNCTTCKNADLKDSSGKCFTPESCQVISQKYGYSYQNGALKPGQRQTAAWQAQKCTTCKPGDLKDSAGKCFTPESCQAISTKYGASYGKNLGDAGDRQTIAWKAQKCTTCAPGDLKDSAGKCFTPESCQAISNKYGTSHHNGWGTAGDRQQRAWNAQNCSTCAPGDLKDSAGKCFTPESCQAISNKYGTSHHNGWGTAGDRQQRAWNAQSCTTCKPGDYKGSDGRCYDMPSCQSISDQFGTYPGDWGTAPSPIRDIWNAQNCTTQPSCSGTWVGSEGSSIWRKRDQLWQDQTGRFYCTAQCGSGLTFTQLSGDAYTCRRTVQERTYSTPRNYYW